MRKLKVLALAINDNKLGGHAYSTLLSLDKNKFEAKLICRNSRYGDKQTAFCASKIKIKLFNTLYRIRSILKYGRWLKRRDKYCFFNDDFSFFNAKQILKKYADSPDVIVVFWADGFINSKIIADLYQKTKAAIVYVLVDQFYMTGGCHYPCECEGYKRDCRECPALINPANIAQKQLSLRSKNLSGLPLFVLGTPYDCGKAKESLLFRGAIMCEDINIPTIPLNMKRTREEARAYFNIPDSAFVIMCGAVRIMDERKGFVFLQEALKKLAADKDKFTKKIVLLIPGNYEKKLIIGGYTVVAPGRLSLENLLMAYYATDIFVSTTIADSGPFMVNYSIACGIPVISFYMGIAADLVIHGKTGYIARMADSDDLYNGIMKFINMSAREYSRYTEECLKLADRYRTNFSGWEKLYNHIVKTSC